jgi:hypothetical protein
MVNVMVVVLGENKNVNKLSICNGVSNNFFNQLKTKNQIHLFIQNNHSKVEF